MFAISKKPRTERGKKLPSNADENFQNHFREKGQKKKKEKTQIN